MSPKKPIRPKTPLPPDQGTPVIRDTTPEISARQPFHIEHPHLDQTANLLTVRGNLPSGSSPTTFQIADLPTGTHIARVANDRPIAGYFLAPRLVDRLPQPDLLTGFRTAGPHTYVDLIDGGTVLLGTDLQSNIRARMSNELWASGPRLEQVAGTVQWRPLASDSPLGTDASQLFVTRVPAPGDNANVIPPKRPRIAGDEQQPGETSGVNRAIADTELDALIDPWKTWGIIGQQDSPDDININGSRYRTLPRGPAPNDPIVYIKHPYHLIYDYATLDRTLRTDFLQQPRGAIRIPPAHQWEIDPTLPFQRPMKDTVASYFPELSDITLHNVAKRQFILANGSELATGTGLTLLRQAFNDWKTGTINPRSELVDPLLMLESLPRSITEGNQKIELPVANVRNGLRRLDFDPVRFRQEWSYFMPSQSAGDIKRFAAGLLTRNGYSVFEPSAAQSFAAVVFKRTGHDLVFFLSLHRVKGRQIHQPLNQDPNTSNIRLIDQVGPDAAQAVEAAHAVNKVVWLRGGVQTFAPHPDTFFIIRDDYARL
ncbi:hypothetical protein [Pseudomonas sp. HS6]|uniref:hypothetical protein n=1 Tax=Pseudomonas sp. HS6 TaxID=2850559 RepID=UPI002018D3F3|nr:hypothetical protein [Pseudomonas sp. HS6]UQS15145.1 hypothetical protein JJN09_28740 [Pseudomonas sp. HS6]